jgi:hypothetical protein
LTSLRILIQSYHPQTVFSPPPSEYFFKRFLIVEERGK